MLTLDQIKESPELISAELETPAGKAFHLRPLLPDDVDVLNMVFNINS